MTDTIYVELIGEGTTCWRPVPASKISDEIYVLGGDGDYDPVDEIWRFPPGTRVLVQQYRSGEGKFLDCHFRAVKAIEGIDYLGDFGIAGSTIHSIARYDGHVAVVLISGGYGRPKGTLFDLTFKDVTALSEGDPKGKLLYGICAVVKPGEERHFKVMTSPTTFCFDFCASTYSICNYAVGDEDIHDSEIVSIDRVGSEVIVTLESNGWIRTKGTRFRLVFKDATILLEERPFGRFLYSLSDSLEESGETTYCFQAEDDEPCLQIKASSLAVRDSD